MNELAARMPQSLLSAEADADPELAALLADTSRLAFRVAYAVLRSREDAEDVAQDAAVRAYRNFRALRDRESFRAWLARIAWRLALDHRRADRRRERREQAVFQGSPPPPSVEAMAASTQAEERVWRAVDALPEKLRVVLVLGAIEGHGTREVAALLDLPEGTVKSRLHAARKSLLKELKWAVNDTKTT